MGNPYPNEVHFAASLVQQMIDTAVAAEREACAKIAEEGECEPDYCCKQTAKAIAEEIRGRGAP